jgi:hypothetical protein
MQERATHQRNRPTADAAGGAVAAWTTLADGIKCAFWPMDPASDIAKAFARRDIVVSHAICFDADIGAKSADRITLAGVSGYFVVEAFQDFRNEGIMSLPLYVVAANLRTV